jgi:hypothetical protein
VSVDAQAGFKKQEYGNAVLSRYPFTASVHALGGLSVLMNADVAVPLPAAAAADASAGAAGAAKESKAASDAAGSSADAKSSSAAAAGKTFALRVGVVHLEPVEEDLRVRQSQAALPLLSAAAPPAGVAVVPAFDCRTGSALKAAAAGGTGISVRAAGAVKGKAPGESKSGSAAAAAGKQKAEAGVPHILLGDLNALRRSDYSDQARSPPQLPSRLSSGSLTVLCACACVQEWKRIADFNEAQRWYAPRGDCMKVGSSQHFKSCIDLLNGCACVRPCCAPGV